MTEKKRHTRKVKYTLNGPFLYNMKFDDKDNERDCTK